MLKRIREFKWGYIFISLISLLIGILLFSFGHDALDGLAIAIGITVILSAAILVILVIADKNRGFGFAVKIVIAIAMLICGIAVLINRESAITIIISIFGLVMIIDGAFKFQTTANSKQIHAFGWWILLILSITLIAGGYYSVSLPEREAAKYVLATAFVIDSIANFLSAFYLGFIEKKSKQKMKMQILDEMQEKESTERSDYESKIYNEETIINENDQ